MIFFISVEVAMVSVFKCTLIFLFFLNFLLQTVTVSVRLITSCPA